MIKTIQGCDTLRTIRSGGRQSTSDKHSWDLVQIAAMRGRNLDNPSDGTTTQQRLEVNAHGTSNTLTSVQKDNLVVPYSMGSGKPGRSTILAARIPEVGTAFQSIRRLTEIECERLQGFPDNWTQGISATQRYKCLGNAVSVPVVQAVGEAIRGAL